ncbi:serine hydrolase domain-containing protein [Acidobacteriota bacterium]
MKQKGKVILLVFFISNIFLTGVSAGQAPWPTEEWPKSTPLEQGLHSETLSELIDLIREGKTYPNQHSLLIVRNGYLVVEEYFGGNKAGSPHMLQSVSKSFTSALMGIAMDQGKIKGIDEKVLGFFPDIKGIKNMDDRKKSMRLRDLLTMRSGTDYHERGAGSPHYQLNALERGWDLFYLNRPMTSTPGTQFLYDSGGVILLSAMLKNRTGDHADKYAEKHLFSHLGIKKYQWFKNREDHPHTGGGLSLSSLDMAKFGLLYLRNGKWGDKQVVPARWVEESLKKHVTFTGQSSRRETGYGYLWWIQDPDPDGSGKLDIISARGAYGQYIFLIPEHEMVVVVTARTRGNQFNSAIDYLYSHILKAVHRNTVEKK